MYEHENTRLQKKQRQFDLLSDFLDYEKKKKSAMKAIKDNDELISAYDYGYEDAITHLFDLANLVYLEDQKCSPKNATLQFASLSVLYDALKRRPFESIYEVLKRLLKDGALVHYEAIPSHSDFKYPFKPRTIKYNLKQLMN